MVCCLCLYLCLCVLYVWMYRSMLFPIGFVLVYHPSLHSVCFYPAPYFLCAFFVAFCLLLFAYCF
ncbi:MAG: hypothetical protein J3R72DRAFT_446345 [Linnemannia gamsii]|nr:MAG: hypothetical protein J3R72DRAFT_446345 [Linnemannia gamsii]